MKRDDFDAWAEKVRASPDKLDADSYARLAKPGPLDEPKFYSSYKPGLFEAIIRKYHGGNSHAETSAAR